MKKKPLYDRLNPHYRAELEAFAQEHCQVETLQSRHRDSLDFHDVSCRGLLEALHAAYEAGARSAQ